MRMDVFRRMKRAAEGESRRYDTTIDRNVVTLGLPSSLDINLRIDIKTGDGYAHVWYHTFTGEIGYPRSRNFDDGEYSRATLDYRKDEGLSTKPKQSLVSRLANLPRDMPWNIEGFGTKPGDLVLEASVMEYNRRRKERRSRRV